MWIFQFKPRTEDPERLRRFINHLESLDWGATPEALGLVYAAVNDLIYHEVLYYYKARKRGRRISGWTRGLALLLGTAGIMIPLLTTADGALFKAISPYGYPCLAAAAACLAFNKLFGATDSHIRYVTAQLELERLLTKFRLEWLAWCASNGGTCTPEVAASAFAIMNEFVNNAYRVIQDETLSWGSATTQNMRDYDSSLPKPPAS